MNFLSNHQNGICQEPSSIFLLIQAKDLLFLYCFKYVKGCHGIFINAQLQCVTR